MEHGYGLPEALFQGQTVPQYPPDYNYQDEAHRFGQAGRLWAQAAAPGTDTWVPLRPASSPAWEAWTSPSRMASFTMPVPCGPTYDGWSPRTRAHAAYVSCRRLAVTEVCRGPQ